MIKIPRMLQNAILEHARCEAPDECCGIVMGQGHVITDIKRSANVTQGDPQRTFELDPKMRFEALKAERDAKPDKCRMIGFYHSHTSTAPFPSETDKAMAHEPDLIWFITDGQTVNAFVFDEALGHFQQMDIEIT